VLVRRGKFEKKEEKTWEKIREKIGKKLEKNSTPTTSEAFPSLPFRIGGFLIPVFT
jgi:hypothetical protein